MTDQQPILATSFSRFVAIYRELADGKPTFPPQVMERLPEVQRLLTYREADLRRAFGDQVLSTEPRGLMRQLVAALAELEAFCGIGHRPSAPSLARRSTGQTVRRFRHTGRPPIAWNAGRGIRRWG